mgnify:CR=1 FL=1
MQLGFLYQASPEWSFGGSITTPQNYGTYEWNSTNADPTSLAFGTNRVLTYDLNGPMIASFGLGFIMLLILFRSVVLPQGTQQLRDVVLEWDPVPGAVAYEIRVSTDNGFNTIRLGLYYARVEPRPGEFDDAYLDDYAYLVHGLLALHDATAAMEEQMTNAEMRTRVTLMPARRAASSIRPLRLANPSTALP